jgi:hypothetical protein
MKTTMHRVLLWGLLAWCGVSILGASAAHAVPAPNDHTVLILDPTVSGGASSIEANAAILAGMDVEVVDATTWAGMSAADFDSYRAIVLGDNYCTSVGAIAAAIANNAVWGPTVDGHVVIIGTDPVFHSGLPGAQALIEKSMAFAVSEVGKTGLYGCLSCYYDGADPGTPVPLLDGLGAGPFTVQSSGCNNAAHIVATHAALAGLTDEMLSDWSCSTHELFETWPATFEVLAIALNDGSPFVAPDGTRGYPYILARGVDVISDIALAPLEATNPVGTPHEVCATVTVEASPVAGVELTFTVVSGPHAGSIGTATTNAEGIACATYTGTSEGQDIIEATGTVDGRPQRSNRVVKNWGTGGGVDVTPPVLSCPEDIYVPCKNGRGAQVDYVVTAIDDTDPTPTIVCTPPSGSYFPTGISDVVCTATDDAGNSSECRFRIIVFPTECPNGPNFWRRRPGQWPVDELTLGTILYDKARLIGILELEPAGDASLRLARQLITAKLNVENCVDPRPILKVIEEADALLTGKVPMLVPPRSPLGEQMIQYAQWLRNYNDGLLFPGCKNPTDLAYRTDTEAVPGESYLGRNTPNPFGQRTAITYALARAGVARVAVYDVSGRELKVLVDGKQAAGKHSVEWDGTDAAGARMKDGVYFYRLVTDGYRSTQKMILMGGQ